MLFEAVTNYLRYALLASQNSSRKLNVGQGLVEYALILVLVAVVVIVILAIAGTSLGNAYSNIVCNLYTIQGQACP